MLDSTKHIKTLEEAGLVNINSQGRERFCFANPKERIDYLNDLQISSLAIGSAIQEKWPEKTEEDRCKLMHAGWLLSQSSNWDGWKFPPQTYLSFEDLIENGELAKDRVFLHPIDLGVTPPISPTRTTHKVVTERLCRDPLAERVAPQPAAAAAEKAPPKKGVFLKTLLPTTQKVTACAQSRPASPAAREEIPPPRSLSI